MHGYNGKEESMFINQVKRLLGRNGYRWKDNIKSDLRKIVYEAMSWTEPTQKRVQCQAFVSMVMDLMGFIKARNSLTS
jgi:hypothetical protein